MLSQYSEGERGRSQEGQENNFCRKFMTQGGSWRLEKTGELACQAATECPAQYKRVSLSGIQFNLLKTPHQETEAQHPTLLIIVSSLRNFPLQTLCWVRRDPLYMLANHGPLCTEATVNHDSDVLLGLGFQCFWWAQLLISIQGGLCHVPVMTLMLELFTEVFLYVCHMHR